MTRELLIEALLQALREDFSTSRDVAQQLEELIDQPDQRLTLLRLVADGLHQMEEWSDAFETYIKIVDLGEDDQTLEIANRQISVRADRWIRSRLAELRSTATDEVRAEMDMVIEQRLTDLGDDATADERLEPLLA